MSLYIHEKYGRMYKEAYSSGLIEEVMEFHQPKDIFLSVYDISIQNLINLIEKTEIVNLELSNEQLYDLMQNITMFFIYLYNETTHGVDLEYLKKFDLLSKSYDVSLRRPFMNTDMMYAVLNTIIFGKSLESIGLDYILDEYTFHLNFFMDPSLDDYSGYYNDYFTMDFMNNSFSINWPKNNPLIVKK